MRDGKKQALLCIDDIQKCAEDFLNHKVRRTVPNATFSTEYKDLQQLQKAY